MKNMMIEIGVCPVSVNFVFFFIGKIMIERMDLRVV